ncbi:MAG: lptF [Alphaproteobacteria bacterium]|nr:lptF [Alphaproteobacteria bacterium]
MILTATDRYLARLIVVPLVSTLTLAAMLLLLDKMLKLFNIVIATGGPVGIVWKMLADLLPEYFSLGIPIGVLLGVLLAFRKLALTSELDTLRGVGLSYTRLLRVPFLYAVGLMALNIVIVGFLQPYAHYGYQQLRFELRSGALGASIRVGEFTSLGRHMTMRVERSEQEGRLLHGVFVSAEMKGGKSIAVTADHGTFLATDDPDVILLRLQNGRLVHNAPDYPRPRVLTFTTQDLPVNVPAVERFRGRSGSDELTLPELLKLGTAQRIPPDQALAARAQFHYRLVEIVMMLLMPVLAVALAVPPKRSTSGLGIFVAIVMVVTYHKVNQYAEHMGELGRVHPVVALWTPFLLFSALILWMYWTLAYKPGGQPIGALERVADKAKKAFLRLLRLGKSRERDPVPAA